MGARRVDGGARPRICRGRIRNNREPRGRFSHTFPPVPRDCDKKDRSAYIYTIRGREMCLNHESARLKKKKKTRRNSLANWLRIKPKRSTRFELYRIDRICRDYGLPTLICSLLARLKCC